MLWSIVVYQSRYVHSGSPQRAVQARTREASTVMCSMCWRKARSNGVGIWRPHRRAAPSASGASQRLCPRRRAQPRPRGASRINAAAVRFHSTSVLCAYASFTVCVPVPVAPSSARIGICRQRVGRSWRGPRVLLVPSHDAKLDEHGPSRARASTDFLLSLLVFT
jgi:hypothetical protein